MKMKNYIRLVPALVTLIVGSGQAQNLYLDFAAAETDGTFPDGVTRTWNVLTSTSATGLLDENGDATTVDLAASMGTSSLNLSVGYDDGNTQAPGLDWASDASGDCWGLATSTDTAPHSMTFSGLMPNRGYHLVIFGGRFLPDSGQVGRDLGIRVQGGAWVVKATALAQTWLFNVKANASGEILMELWSVGFTHFCAMSITEIDNLDGTAYVDFGTKEIDHTYTDTRTWNAITNSAVLLVDEDGNPTTVDLTITEDRFSSKNEIYGYDQGNSQPATGGVVDGWASDALGDCWYVGEALPDELNKLELSGLEPGATYDLVIFGGRKYSILTDNRDLAIEVNDWAMLPGGWTVKNTSFDAVWQFRVAATSAGKIQIAMIETNANNFAHLNAMSIAKVTLPDLSTTAYVDCSGVQSVSGADAQGRYWNTAGASVCNAGFISLVDSANTATKVALGVTDKFASDGLTGYLGGQSSVVDWPTEVTADCWTLGVADPAASMRIYGLVPEASYSLTFYGGRISTGADRDLIITNVTNGGSALTLHTLIEDKGTLSATADAGGEIELGFTYTGAMAHFCAMSITYLPTGTVILIR